MSCNAADLAAMTGVQVTGTLRITVAEAKKRFGTLRTLALLLAAWRA